MSCENYVCFILKTVDHLSNHTIVWFLCKHSLFHPLFHSMLRLTVSRQSNVKNMYKILCIHVNCLEIALHVIPGHTQQNQVPCMFNMSHGRVTFRDIVLLRVCLKGRTGL